MLCNLNTIKKKEEEEQEEVLRCGGTHLQSQHLGG
jgi:hypothetical protein